MSTVYLAMDKNLNKQWAVKEIRKQGNNKIDGAVVNSLQVEANLMKRLDHPALPRIVDIINSDETICIIMDYIEGETLEKILERYGAQPEDVVVEWAMQLCDALMYLHSQNPPIIYRDMKPEFPIVKDTTPNMMNPRLYTTSYNKPQGQQFDDTAVLSFIKLQYT